MSRLGHKTFGAHPAAKNILDLRWDRIILFFLSIVFVFGCNNPIDGGFELDSAKHTQGGGKATSSYVGKLRNVRTESLDPPGGEEELMNARSVLERQDKYIAELFSYPSGLISVSFQNAPIREISQIVFGEKLQMSYAIHPSVSGTLTLNTSAPIEAKNLLHIFETALADHGYILLEERGVINVLPADVVGQKPPKIYLEGLGTPSLGIGYGTQVISLQYVSPKKMLRIIRDVWPANSPRFRANNAGHLLIFSGTADERMAARELIEIFDTNFLGAMAVDIVSIRTANLASIVGELEEIFSAYGSADLDTKVRFISFQRLNAILIIAPTSELLKEAQGWVAKLDRGDIGNQTRLFAYTAKYKSPTALAKLLGYLYSNAKRSGTGNTQGKERRSEGGDLQAVFDSTPVADARGDLDDSNIITEQGFKFTPDNESNVLYVQAPQSNFTEMQEILEQVDTRPSQVMVEATIAEVSLDDELKFGVQWFFESGEASKTVQFLDKTVQPQSRFPGFSYLLKKSDTRAVLNALQSITDVNVLSSPQLMVLNNATAILQVGDQVPITRQSLVNTNVANAASIVNSVELQDTGIILKVRARISGERSVTLDITQEVSNVIETVTSSIDSPTIQQRRISSKIIVSDGQSVALGGLIRSASENNNAGVPILSQIPILGNLFAGRKISDEKTELLVLITPRIIRDDNEALSITRDIKNKMQHLVEDLFDGQE